MFFNKNILLLIIYECNNECNNEYNNECNNECKFIKRPFECILICKKCVIEQEYMV